MASDWFSVITRNRNAIVFLFKAVYFLLILLLVFAGKSTYVRDSAYPMYYDFAVICGKAALTLYVLTMVPGMVRRFGLFIKPVAVLMVFRRYIGILMYLVAFIHASVIRFISMIRTGRFIAGPLFILAGSSALFMLFWLFITSNDWSVNRLGAWWKKVHALTYVALGFIVAHVALQRVSVWSVVIGGAAVMQIASFVYAAVRRKAAS